MAATPPVSAADFESAVIKPGDRACDFVSKVTTISTLLSDWYSWALNADGTPTTDFLDWSGGSGGSTAMPAPSNVTASTNDTAKIIVGWNSVDGATGYRLYRGLTADTRLMAAVADVTVTSYNDVGTDPGGPVVDTTYFYAVKAFNATLTSTFSGTASGSRPTSTSPSADVSQNLYDSTAVTVTVPTGKNRVEWEAWGGGGKGGDGPPFGVYSIGDHPPTAYGGGGGASGSYNHWTGMEVTAGETFRVQVGGPGAETRITRVSDGTIMTATPGQAGGPGSFSTYGAAGAPATNYGTCTFATGSLGSGPTVGEAGDDDQGGAAVGSDNTDRGEGGDGSTTMGASGSDGTGGRVRYKFTAV